ncbi:MAG: (Fe-S)-binding protein [Desulfatiglandales bacterium]
MNKLLEQIDACTDCDACMDVCPTYRVTGELLFSPKGRLASSRTVLTEGPVDEEVLNSIYNCPKCMACEAVCPQAIEVTKIVAAARNKAVEMGQGPLKPHRKVLQGILDKGNSVNGDPAKRLEWLPEPFERRQSDTLLYVGCLPAYLVKDAATYSYLALKKLGVDFMIIEDEGCCGTYMYEAGEIEKAKDYFARNVERFAKLGVKKLIVPCNGCFKCFGTFYPELLGSVDFEVTHVVQTFYEEIKDRPEILRSIEREITYQDSCRLGRAAGITEEPRDLLKWCGATLKELPLNREQTPCCGSGGGIRSAFRDLSFDIAKGLLADAPTQDLVSPCPFCTFNLGYTNKKAEMDKQVTYISKVIWESLKDA